jgi:hypothetical protein
MFNGLLNRVRADLVSTTCYERSFRHPINSRLRPMGGPDQVFLRLYYRIPSVIVSVRKK